MRALTAHAPGLPIRGQRGRRRTGAGGLALLEPQARVTCSLETAADAAVYLSLWLSGTVGLSLSSLLGPDDGMIPRSGWVGVRSGFRTPENQPRDLLIYLTPQQICFTRQFGCSSSTSPLYSGALNELDFHLGLKGLDTPALSLLRQGPPGMKHEAFRDLAHHGT